MLDFTSILPIRSPKGAPDGPRLLHLPGAMVGGEDESSQGQLRYCLLSAYAPGLTCGTPTAFDR
jgi:hypothetical protein